MNREEAHKIALWNKIHKAIRTEIVNNVKRGNLSATIYKSFMRETFDYVSMYVGVLQELGFTVEYKKLELMDNKIDYIYRISWD